MSPLPNALPYVDCRPMVQRFAQDMERELQANDHKRGICEMPLGAMLRRLKQEVAELERAIDGGANPSKVLSEAADVGNYSAAIAHWARETLAERGP